MNMYINGSMSNEETVNEVAVEFFSMWENGVMDERYTEAEFEEGINMEDAMDYVMSEAPKETRFLGKEKVREIVAKERKNYI